MTYCVRRAAAPPPPNADWESDMWRHVTPLALACHMGPPPPFRPVTEAKLAYDDAAVYVVFRVQDKYVRSVCTERHGDVCRDSCVELFFTPGPDVAEGYFNLEINAGGTMLFHFQKRRHEGEARIADSDCDRIEMARTLPEIVDPEIPGPLTWSLAYRLPVDILERHCRVDRPAPGVRWRANFYKCASDTSNPHWLTWAPIDRPKPEFHVPSDFGDLQFG